MPVWLHLTGMSIMTPSTPIIFVFFFAIGILRICPNGVSACWHKKRASWIFVVSIQPDDVSISNIR